MIQLKTRKPGTDQKFARLVEPDLTGKVRSDEDMYSAILTHGFAVVSEFDGASYNAQAPVRLTPKEFFAAWRGD